MGNTLENALDVDATYTFKETAVCVKECPRETDSSFECKGTSISTEETCKTPFSETKLDGFIGYGTDPLFNKFCFPNINKLPKEMNETLDEYNNLVGDFGLDDIQ